MEDDKKNGGMKGKQNALKYGGEGAIKRISEGKPLLGIAAEEEKAVTAELADKGVSDIVRADAVKLQAAANLYWNAVMKAAQDGDINALDRYVARFGWIQGVTLRAWMQVRNDEKDKAKGGVPIVDVLAAMDAAREGGGNG